MSWPKRKGHLGMAKRLLSKGASANLPNLLGQTPLMYAAGFGTEELVLLILAALKPGERRGMDSQGRWVRCWRTNASYGEGLEEGWERAMTARDCRVVW